ncbi:MAG: glycosyltransferase family 39 protein [Chloroflexi bacterium]|nr:glycosyltransferase family 39 protein [Chloroflexota bacterium]
MQLFVLAGLVFALTRLIGLDRWPVYFFTDEAINPLLAADFIRHGFTDGAGQWFPTYFANGQYLSLSTSVYAQVIPYLLFGFSVVVTRAVPALIALSGTLAIGLILRDIFKLRFWWIGTLILSITPAWFLHSRTAFEHPLWVAFYAWFLYFYLRYRTDKPQYLLLSFGCGALSFYSYNGAQLGVVVTGLLLLISDARYHYQTLRHNPRLLAAAAIVLLLVALPFLRFYADHSDETFKHLRILDSYWTQPISMDEKLNRLVQEFAFGLSPDYWYAPENARDLIRHQMKGYGLLLPVTLPFTLLGLLLCLKNFKSSPYRAALIALFIAPIGGVLVQTLVLRVLVMMIPAALLASIGLIAILELIAKRWKYRPVAIGAFAVLAGFNLFMLNDSLTNGLTWYTDYGMGGLQYGGQQIFEEVKDVLRESPQTRVYVSPTWANGTDALLMFFMPDELRVQMGNIDAYMFSQRPLDDNMLLVMTADEYQRNLLDAKFANIRVERTIKYPDGRDGFYFVRLNYSEQASAIFAEEDAARRRPQESDLALDGQTVKTVHSRLDIGPITSAFDGDPFTLVRTVVDNPFFITLTFPEPRTLAGVTLTTATMNFNAAITVTLVSGETQIYNRDYLQTGPDPTNDFPFDPAPAGPIRAIRIDIKDLNAIGDAHIHVREIKLR